MGGYMLAFFNMTNKVKELAPIILEEIKKAENIVINLHVNPDEDSAGSALALMYAINSLGKSADIIEGDSDLPLGFKSLPGAEKILQQDVHETDLSKYDLFIIPDTGGLEQLSKKEKVNLPDSLTTIVIDHHASNSGFGKINLVDPSYPATAQILFDLFRAWGISINKEMATCLYIGIFGDTEGGRHSNTSKESLLAMSELIGIEPDLWNVLNKVENSKNPKAVEYRGLALLSVESFFSGRIPISAIPYEELHLRGIGREDVSTGHIGNELLSVLEWEMGAVLVEAYPGHTSVSLRSKNQDKFDVSKIAKKLGGGGHKAAAGALIKEPAEEAKIALIKAIKSAYPELGNK